MDLATFIQQRRPLWRQLEAILQRVEGSGMRTLDDEQAVEFGRLYRCAASDLNQAQTFVSGDATVHYLNDLVARCYLVIYDKTKVDWWGLLRYLVWGYPAVFRRHLGYLVLSTTIFALGTLFGFIAVWLNPVAKEFLLPSSMPMIQPAKEGEPTDDPVMGTGDLAGFSSHLFRNNMSVTLIAFALGITLGIGTAWVMWYNGILIGALAAVFFEAGQIKGFLTGVLPHGVLEIPAMIIGGAAGFLLARGMLHARPWPRLEELARTGKQAIWLVGGSAPLLVAAALLEAIVARAPDWYLNSGVKLAVAAIFGLLFATYIFTLGWKRKVETD
jgi:uncharacterized membrane protein SpoIIM required for sporulation